MLMLTTITLAIITGGLAIRQTTFTRAGGWCTHGGARMVAADFDGDGTDDVLCYDNAGNHWVRYSKIFRQDEHFPSMNGWCTHVGSRRHVGDFNGDGKADLLCHDKSGNLWIACTDHYGGFTGTTWHEPAGWCGADGTLFVGDFNGDKRTDILCHHNNNGYKWVALAAPSNFFHAKTSWEAPMGWCYHPGAQIFVADFNGDGLQDLLCHDNSGKKWIAFAQNGLYFEGFKQTYYRDMNWCSHGGSQLDVADINGDSRADLICHDGSGSTWTHLNIADKYFDGDNTKYFRFCLGPNERMLVGNFVGDRRKDFLCTATQVWLVMDDVIDK